MIYLALRCETRAMKSMPLHGAHMAEMLLIGDLRRGMLEKPQCTPGFEK